MPSGNYLKKKEQDHLFGKATFTPPATMYVALLTAAPSAGDHGGSLSETTYTGYARAATTGDDWGDSAADGTITNDNAEIAFAAMTGGSSGNVTHFALLSGNTGTSADGLIGWGTLDETEVYSAGETPRFAAGELTMTR